MSEAPGPKKIARSAKKISNAATEPVTIDFTQDLPVKISRKFGRLKADCAAVLAFPARNAHPRVKAQLLQIGKGGCGLATQERMFIGELCLVWATTGGHKFLGVQGKVVWIKSVYKEEHETLFVGIEFERPIELDAALLAHLGVKKKPEST